MKIKNILVELLCLLLIVLTGFIAFGIDTDSFFMAFLKSLPFWITIFVFFDWREWTNFNEIKKRGKKLG